MAVDSVGQNHRRTLFAQWSGAVVPLVAWSGHLAFIYLLAPILCDAAHYVWLYGFTTLALTFDVIAGVVAWRNYRSHAHKPNSSDRDKIRARYFGLLGLSSAVIFAVGIIGQTISLLSVCP